MLNGGVVYGQTRMRWEPAAGRNLLYSSHCPFRRFVHHMSPTGKMPPMRTLSKAGQPETTQKSSIAMIYVKLFTKRLCITCLQDNSILSSLCHAGTDFTPAILDLLALLQCALVATEL